ncbi:MAG: HesA/MoeB/ThiF family protein [Lentisphaeria bacterium]|nr:HesA/MoeB/ThiF family protein [Lentisphaeria bacterium]
MSLTAAQIERYARQIALPEVGVEGQSRLLAAKVLVVGAGGLGSPAALYLAAAGVGTVGIMDGDAVELSNLQRQILHSMASLGRPKTESGARRLRELNPDTMTIAHPEPLTAANAIETVSAYDFVIDATDSFAAKLLIATACHAARKPYSHAGVQGFRGQMLTVQPGRGACLRCVLQEPSPAQAETPQARGVIGVLPGVLGTLQAAEALKAILGTAPLLLDTLLVCDLWTMQFRRVAVSRNPRCPLCGNTTTEL